MVFIHVLIKKNKVKQFCNRFVANYHTMQVRFREFIPSILNVSRQCLAAGEENVAVIAFEIFDELIESPAPLLGDSVKSIVQFSLEVSSSQNLESNTRHQVRKDGSFPNYF